MRYAILLAAALLIGPVIEASAANGGLQIGAQRDQDGSGDKEGYYTGSNRVYTDPDRGCCMDAEVEAISLGLDSDDPDTRSLAGDALKRNLQDQIDK